MLAHVPSDCACFCAHAELGLAFDEQDLVYYTQMFKEEMERDPTNVELFDIAQSNSEHRLALMRYPGCRWY